MESQPSSSNAIISIDNEENKLSASKEVPASLIYETLKQDRINKWINVENKILVVLYKKKGLNQMTENDEKEIKTQQVNLEKLKKKLNDLKLCQKRSK